MNNRTHARIIASLVDQLTDVRLGLLTSARWTELFDAAALAGCEMPASVALINARWTADPFTHARGIPEGQDI